MKHLLSLAVIIIVPFIVIGIGAMVSYVWEKIHGR